EDDPDHDNARQNALWGSLMAGAWGTEWYFGYKHAHSDLSCEDWRSRDLFWDQCNHLLRFVRENELPLPEMQPMNDLSSSTQDWVLAKEGDTYLVLLKMGEKPANMLKVPEGTYTSYWLNPRDGKFTGRSGRHTGTEIKVGAPPSEPEKDWVLFLRKGDR
ncbi:MAG: putative collagen-binding domain-containing protein, partial [Bacteroidota bacterium]